MNCWLVGGYGLHKTQDMAATVLLSLLFLSLQNFCFAEEINVPPFINGSFIAMGEIVAKDGDGDLEQAHFEETYDANTGNAAYRGQVMGLTNLFVEDALANQTFSYFGSQCSLVTKKDLSELPEASFLKAMITDKGNVHFSVKDLFSISNDYLVKDKAAEQTVFRGVPALSWVYKMETGIEDGENKTFIDVYEYWSDKSVSTSSDVDKPVPLGFQLVKLIRDLQNRQMYHLMVHINIYGFVHDAVKKSMFEPHPGVVCPGRSQMFQFPKLTVAKALSFKSELVLPSYSTIKTMDVAFDAVNGLLRVDLDRLDSAEPSYGRRTFTSQITSKNLGKTFVFEVIDSKVTCKASDIKDYKMDTQELLNPKLDMKLWSLDYIIGRNTTNFTNIGKTTRRNIPCHLYQGIRKDWPEADSKVVSLWEWCVVDYIDPVYEPINFKDKEIGLISASVIIQEHPQEAMKNFRMIHNLYNVLEEDPKTFFLTKFDISRCFKVHEKRNLLFSVDYTLKKGDIESVKNATSDIAFLSKWKAIISDKSKLPIQTLRVTAVSSTVFDKALFVYFTILDIHPDLKKSSGDQPSMDDAFKSLQDAVNAGTVEIKHTLGEEQVSLKAAKDSLKDVVGDTKDIVNPTGKPITVPPVTERTLGPFTLDTADPRPRESTTDEDRETTDAPIDKKESPSGHSPGTVAGVTIVMLIIGFTAGAGGTFYKFRGSR